MITHEPTKSLLRQMIADIPDDVRLQYEMSEAIASRIDNVLKEKHMSQKDLALTVGHSQGEVSRWLSGTHNFTLSTLAKISVALNKNILAP